MLFFMGLSTRTMRIGGIAGPPNGLWMSQVGRNLTDAISGILNGKRYLIGCGSVTNLNTNDSNGTPERIRTSGLLLRRQTLYPG